MQWVPLGMRKLSPGMKVCSLPSPSVMTTVLLRTTQKFIRRIAGQDLLVLELAEELQAARRGVVAVEADSG